MCVSSTWNKYITVLFEAALFLLRHENIRHIRFFYWLRRNEICTFHKERFWESLRILFLCWLQEFLWICMYPENIINLVKKICQYNVYVFIGYFLSFSLLTLNIVSYDNYRAITYNLWKFQFDSYIIIKVIKCTILTNK